MDWILEAKEAKRSHIEPEDITNSVKYFCENNPIENRTFTFYYYKWGRENLSHRYSQSAFKRYFGNFRNAIKKAGFEYDNREYKRIKKEIVDQDLKNFCNLTNVKERTLKKFLEWKGRIISQYSIQHYYGSFSNALKKNGFTPNNSKGKPKFTNLDILKFFENICVWTFNRKKSRPLRKDLFSYNKLFNDGVSYGTLIRRFGSYKDFSNKFFLWKQGKLSFEDLVDQKKNSKKQLSPRLRFEIITRDNFRCVLCGANSKKTVLHVDHILPRSKGGEDTTSNLRTLCSRCNLGRSNKFIE